VNSNEPTDLNELEQERMKIEIERAELELEKMKLEKAKQEQANSQPAKPATKSENHKWKSLEEKTPEEIAKFWDVSKDEVWGQKDGAFKFWGFFFSPVAIYLVWKYHPAFVPGKIIISLIALAVNSFVIYLIGNTLGLF